MAKTSTPHKRPPLTVLEELFVLGGRYMISRGQTASGQPVVYISGGRGKPGLTILAVNARAFQAAFGKALDKFPECDGDGTMQPATEDGILTYGSEHSLCPSLKDESWQQMTIASGNDAAVLAKMLGEHSFKEDTNVVTGAAIAACGICGYDTTKVEEYAKWFRQQAGTPKRRKK